MIAFLKSLVLIIPLIRDLLKRWDSFKKNREIDKLEKKKAKESKLELELRHAQSDEERADILKRLNSI